MGSMGWMEIAMFQIFSSRNAEMDRGTIDAQGLIERIGRALDDSGIESGSRTHTAVLKMLADDLRWYFENVADDDSLES